MATAYLKDTASRQLAGGAPLGRVAGLDGLRGIAILLVMLFHQTLTVGSTGVDRFVAFWTLGGWIGVDLFFVLSGFLITGILYDAKRSTGYFRNFYARRVLRIAPLYYGVVAFSLLILPHLPYWKPDALARIDGDEWWYWLYLSNISIAMHDAFRHGILDVSWSLAIEEQFYLTWPLIVLITDRRRLISLCYFLIALAFVWRTSLVVAGVSPVAVSVLTPGHFDSLAVGGLIALVARSPAGLAPLRRWATWVGMAAAASITVLAAWSGGFDSSAVPIESIGYTVLALGFGSLLVIILTSSHTHIINRLLNKGPLIALGKYSYALYLFHLPIRAVIRDKVYGPEQFLTIMGSSLPGQLIFYVMATFAAFVAAWISWHLFENRFLNLKRYFAPHARTVGDSSLHPERTSAPASHALVERR
jgi:peptidoglycan/LPS O-acetylase OafA/YrhL